MSVMERLTERNIDGKAVCKKEISRYCDNNCSECDYDYQCLNKLADYEDAEEQGLLLRVAGKDTFPKEIEQILKNQIVIMGMLQEIKFAYLDEDDVPDKLQNINDTHKILIENKKLKEMERE